MFISKIHIKNFRAFDDTVVEFAPGVTVLIGENNSGKTAILQAMSLVLQRTGRERPTIEDFHRGITPSAAPPEIAISLTFMSSSNDTIEEQAMVATWLTKLSDKWEAMLTYKFFLPPSDSDKFKEEWEKWETQGKDNGGVNPTDAYWDLVEKYMPKFVGRIYGGLPETGLRVEHDVIEHIDYRQLDALRDAEAEMFMGRHPLLKRMLRKVLDRKAKDENEREIARRDFRENAKSMTGKIQNRLDTDSQFALVDSTGASDCGKPALGGRFTEDDLISALRMMVKPVKFEVPLTHNGLGYNNLIYISLILAEMSLRSSTEEGENATVFPVLAIEEPEAHLHPSMQYKLLKYLVERVKDPTHSSRQVFVTTHSTHVTAASALDSIVCMSIAGDGSRRAIYPGRLFPDTSVGQDSKKYVERYLDATKSTMLFARAVLFVEGLAEQLLFPVFAEYIGCSLEKSHVALVPVGGVTFKHFLPLFGAGHKEGQVALDRRVACVIDCDPSRKKKEKRARWSSCFPFQLDLNTTDFEYKAPSSAVTNLEDKTERADNIIVRTGTKTLEYDLALTNAESELIATSSLPNLKELSALMRKDSDWEQNLEELLDGDALGDLKIPGSCSDFYLHGSAACYLNAADGVKGEHALELAAKLRDNLSKKHDDQTPFKVPDHIAQAIQWVCNKPDGATV